MDLEIIIPIRNPTDVLRQTIASLVAQTDRGFRVLISDNFSAKGGEFIDDAMAQLRSAGLVARRVQPPAELGRVEHWNWAHHAATGAWLKPLFAGDWLEKHYVARVRAAAASHPECRYVFANYTIHRSGQPPMSEAKQWGARFHSAAELRSLVLRIGMQFGPPSVAAYHREAFIAAGGYATALPIAADSLLFCTLAATFGAVGLDEPLCHFNIHDARFSTTLPGKRRDTLRECLAYYWMLAAHAWADRFAFSKLAFARLVARDLRHYWAGR
ncbi:MAG: glycosyltransferase [Verrucomicrobia bacterium]|nr:glycosyltransferase [Verrucomicrobiota bacterium]